jgi:hypothetical protein
MNHFKWGGKVINKRDGGNAYGEIKFLLVPLVPSTLEQGY